MDNNVCFLSVSGNQLLPITKSQREPRKILFWGWGSLCPLNHMILWVASKRGNSNFPALYNHLILFIYTLSIHIRKNKAVTRSGGREGIGSPAQSYGLTEAQLSYRPSETP